MFSRLPSTSGGSRQSQGPSALRASESKGKVDGDDVPGRDGTSGFTRTDAKEVTDDCAGDVETNTKVPAGQCVDSVPEAGAGTVGVNEQTSAEESSRSCGTKSGGEKRPSEAADSEPRSKSARAERVDETDPVASPPTSAERQPAPASAPATAISGFFARKERQIRAEQAAVAAAAAGAAGESAASAAPAQTSSSTSSARVPPPEQNTERRVALSPVRPSSRGPSSPARRGRGRGSGASRRGRGRGSRPATSPDKRCRLGVPTTVEADTLELDGDSVDADTLAALPEDIRREVEEQLDRRRRRRQQEDTQARNGIRRYLRTAAAVGKEGAGTGVAVSAVGAKGGTERDEGQTVKSEGSAPALEAGTSGAGSADPGVSESATRGQHGATDRAGSPCAAGAIRVPSPAVAGPSGLCRSTVSEAAPAAPAAAAGPPLAVPGPSHVQGTSSAASAVPAAGGTATSSPAVPVVTIPDDDDSSSDVPGASSASDSVSCPRCGQSVSPWELPEHLDYHMAVELSEQVTPPLPAPVRPPTRPPARSRGPAVRKRGRPSKAETLRRAGEVRRIDVFFK